MAWTRFIGITVVLLASAGMNANSLAADPADEQWEYQGSMEMMGMKMPIPPTTRCEKPTQERTPPVDANCTFSEVEVKGDTTSFKVRCGPPEPMEGSGTTTRTADRLDAKYTLQSEEGKMTFVMSGKKLGPCKP